MSAVMPGQLMGVSPHDLTTGLADAIQIWSEFLKGERSNREWGVASASFFLTSIGFATPSQPISAENLRQLRIAAEGARLLRDNPNWGPKQTKQANALDHLAPSFAQYFRDNCLVEISAQTPPTNLIENSCSDVDTAADAVMNTYQQPEDAFSGTGYGSAPPSAVNDYSQIPDARYDTVPQNEYDVVGEGMTQEEAYMRPPPPETHFDAIATNHGL